MCDPATLDNVFGIPGVATFSAGSHGARVTEVSTAAGAATITCQGAQALTWAPSGQPSAVWLSPGGSHTLATVTRVETD